MPNVEHRSDIKPKVDIRYLHLHPSYRVYAIEIFLDNFAITWVMFSRLLVFLVCQQLCWLQRIDGSLSNTGNDFYYLRNAIVKKYNYICTLPNTISAQAFNDFFLLSLQCICFVLSTCCVFLCMIASVFPGIHGSRISSFADCTVVNGSCQCVKTLEDPHATVYRYLHVISCDMVITSIKDYFILQCALNAIASGVCFWFVTLLWKSRYQAFYSGLRFYPYSTHTHATRQYASNPQTYANGHPPSPICVKKSRVTSKRALEYGEEKQQEVDAQEPLQCDEVWW